MSWGFKYLRIRKFWSLLAELGTVQCVKFITSNLNPGYLRFQCSRKRIMGFQAVCHYLSKESELMVYYQCSQFELTSSFPTIHLFCTLRSILAPKIHLLDSDLKVNSKILYSHLSNKRVHRLEFFLKFDKWVGSL